MRAIAFHPEIRRLLALAREEARALGHEQVGTEHLLLALVHAGPNAGLELLARMGVDAARVTPAPAPAVPHRHRLVFGGAELPYTGAVRLAIEHATDEARARGAPAVDAADLVLGLLRGEARDGSAATVLAASGVTLSRARAAIRGAERASGA